MYTFKIRIQFKNCFVGFSKYVIDLSKKRFEPILVLEKKILIENFSIMLTKQSQIRSLNSVASIKYRLKAHSSI